jgi:hypothetical protein
LAGVPDGIAERVVRGVTHWDDALVKQKLREFSVEFDGRSSVGSLRQLLIEFLAREWARGNPAAEALF